jgi:hypothetical protein
VAHAAKDRFFPVKLLQAAEVGAQLVAAEKSKGGVKTGAAVKWKRGGRDEPAAWQRGMENSGADGEGKAECLH